MRRAAHSTEARPRRHGVTLIELLVALGLAAALLGAVIVFVGDLAEARERIERLSERDRAIDAFMDVVEVAVATSVLDGGSSAFVGDATSCTIQSANVDPAPSVDPEGRPFVPTTATWIGFDATSGALLVRRGATPQEPLPVESSALRLRYHDGQEWVDSYDARERGRLPTAIEVSIWLAPPGSRAKTADEVDDVRDSILPPDRRRVIAIPDSAPADLLPAAARRVA